MELKFKKLHDNARLPRYAKKGDAGMDCFATEYFETDNYVGYKLGFAVEIPEGYVGLMFPRSSNCKKELLMCNSVGVIDSGYRGEVEARFQRMNELYHSEGIYNVGDAVCQLIVLPYPEMQTSWVDELTTTDRGDGGFGSTGN